LPLYEYACKKCGHHHERIESFKGPNLRVCPDCGGKVEQVITAPAVQFKGSGWYVTDYAGKSNTGDAAKSESGDSTKSSEAKGAKDSSGGKAESKDTKESKDGKKTKAAKDKK
jgi:putative FmdB family regulatory protein